MNTQPEPTPLDIDEIRRIVQSLETDLAALPRDSTRLAAARTEVEQLRALLDADEHDHAEMHSGLSRAQASLHELSDEVLVDATGFADYVARIGRILGL